MKYKKTILPNGLRIITIPTKDNPAVTVMVAIETGSNYEDKNTNGLSHFLEHMFFKGTTNRPKSIDISREFDNVGAHNNAFTSNEVTGYYAKAGKKHFRKILEILSDMYLNPTFPVDDLEKERGVILQEISMYEDLPQRIVGNVFHRLMYGDTPAGRTILGPAKNIKTFKREGFVEYRKKHYVAKSTMIIVSGDFQEKAAINDIKKYFKNISTSKKSPKQKVLEKQSTPGLLIHPKTTDQTHMIMGFRAYKADDKRLPALHVMNAVLGKGTSSRLFQKLREDMGVCYYVKSGMDEFTDHGYIAIATGVDKKRSEEVVKVLIEECKKLKEEPVSEEEISKAKEIIIGNMYLELETSDSLAEFYLEQEITTGKMKLPQDIEKEIRKVTAKDIQKVAKEIFQNKNLNLAIVGQIQDKKTIKRTLSI
jgi:predicted Zn-dependent peptidase